MKVELKKKTIAYIGKKDGKEHKTTNFYIVLDNGQYIGIKPAFDEGYGLLRLIAENEEK